MIKTILVIEDHAGWREHLEGALTGLGYSVHTAEDWYLANQLAAQNSYDLIISDNQLGENRSHWGVNIIPLLKRRLPEVKTILISTEDIEKHPADLFINKSSMHEQLQAAILQLGSD